MEHLVVTTESTSTYVLDKTMAQQPESCNEQSRTFISTKLQVEIDTTQVPLVGWNCFCERSEWDSECTMMCGSSNNVWTPDLNAVLKSVHYRSVFSRIDQERSLEAKHICSVRGFNTKLELLYTHISGISLNNTEDTNMWILSKEICTSYVTPLTDVRHAFTSRPQNLMLTEEEEQKKYPLVRSTQAFILQYGKVLHQGHVYLKEGHMWIDFQKLRIILLPTSEERRICWEPLTLKGLPENIDVLSKEWAAWDDAPIVDHSFTCEITHNSVVIFRHRLAIHEKSISDDRKLIYEQFHSNETLFFTYAYDDLSSLTNSKNIVTKVTATISPGFFNPNASRRRR
jgi:hypothetical protein